MKTNITARAPGLLRGLLGIALLCVCGCGGPDSETAALRSRVHELERQVEELVREDRLLRLEIPPDPEMSPEEDLSTRELVAAAFASYRATIDELRDQIADLMTAYPKIHAELEALKKR